METIINMSTALKSCGALYSPLFIIVVWCCYDFIVVGVVVYDDDVMISLSLLLVLLRFFVFIDLTFFFITILL